MSGNSSIVAVEVHPTDRAALENALAVLAEAGVKIVHPANPLFATFDAEGAPTVKCCFYMEIPPLRFSPDGGDL